MVDHLPADSKFKFQLHFLHSFIVLVNIVAFLMVFNLLEIRTKIVFWKKLNWLFSLSIRWTIEKIELIISIFPKYNCFANFFHQVTPKCSRNLGVASADP